MYVQVSFSHLPLKQVETWPLLLILYVVVLISQMFWPSLCLMGGSGTESSICTYISDLISKVLLFVLLHLTFV